MKLMMPGCRASFWIAPGEPLRRGCSWAPSPFAHGTFILRLRVMLHILMLPLLPYAAMRMAPLSCCCK